MAENNSALLVLVVGSISRSIVEAQREAVRCYLLSHHGDQIAVESPQRSTLH
jgi:hypothetical protein